MSESGDKPKKKVDRRKAFRAWTFLVQSRAWCIVTTIHGEVVHAAGPHDNREAARAYGREWIEHYRGGRVTTRLAKDCDGLKITSALKSAIFSNLGISGD